MITHNKQHLDPYATTGPYVHHVGPHEWEAYRDGYWQGSTERTYTEAARWLFMPYSHGYPISYYPTDENGELVGDVVCAECAAKEWIADPSQGFIAGLEDGDNTLEYAVICNNCGAEIAPLRCRLCFDPIEERPWHKRTDPPLPIFQGDNGYHAIHGECIAKLIANPDQYERDQPRPVKTGKLTYLIPSIDSQTYVGESIR